MCAIGEAFKERCCYSHILLFNTSLVTSVEHTKRGGEEEGSHVEDDVPSPSPRSNCSLIINPLKETELVLYGGEFYNGNMTFVNGDLYRYDMKKQERKLISSPNSLPPRSAHQAVTWKNYLYIYGGEFTSKSRTFPSLQGIKVALVHDQVTERYYNDLHVFDLDQYKCQEVKPRPGALWPGARSGFQFVVFQDEIRYLWLRFIYMAVIQKMFHHQTKKSLRRETFIQTCGALILEPGSGIRSYGVKKSGMPPGPRAGFSMCVHEKRALIFGGVIDMGMECHYVIS
ncbi:hypothetical protein OROGR_012528 [Orobanche gracilis]